MSFKSICILFTFLVPLALLHPNAAFAQLDTYQDSLSYTLGADLADNLSKIPLDINSDMIFQGMIDVLDGGENKFDDQQVRELMMAFQQQAMQAQQAEMAERGKVAKAEGEIFLEENKAKEGIQTTASGLQYKIMRPGTGASPGASSVVKVHYEGRLINEEVFDSSYQRGEPIEFAVNGVIPGWTEALQLMKTGAKWQLYIPYHIAYGERGSPPSIGPYETLIFDVELLEVK
ncbi:MAG: FKBP-type peptidyl-prolyl cis-trans isomerase [Bacteroidota bacterium]